MKWSPLISPKHKVYLGVPTHDGRVGQGIVNAILGGGKCLDKTHIENGSALACNFNKIYCSALNNRKHGVTHFALLHEDIWPREPMWVDKMIELMEKSEADILSAVVPIKDEMGLTSTAIEIPDPDNPRNPLGYKARKLSLRECHEDYGPTFTDPMLLVASGVLLVDLREPWAETLSFDFRDGIAKGPDGTFFPVSEAEHFVFSRKAREAGARIYATTEIPLWHMGGGRWGNTRADAGISPVMEAV